MSRELVEKEKEKSFFIILICRFFNSCVKEFEEVERTAARRGDVPGVAHET